MGETEVEKERKTFEETDIIGHILSAIGDAVEDLTQLTIVTTTGKIKTKHNSDGKAYLDIEETSISAKTIIQLDGDIITRIPVTSEEDEPLQIDERMLQLHEKNVELAIKNWQTVINTLVVMIKSFSGK